MLRGVKTNLIFHGPLFYSPWGPGRGHGWGLGDQLPGDIECDKNPTRTWPKSERIMSRNWHVLDYTRLLHNLYLAPILKKEL